MYNLRNLIMRPSQNKQNDGEEGPAEFALRNPLVLRHIFIHLPTRELIKSCSLVNKTWNVQARSFVRDHRDCWLHIKTRNPRSMCAVCSSLLELEETLKSMNVIPINCISINAFPTKVTRGCRDLRQHKDSAEGITELENITKLKVKNLHVDIVGNMGSTCYNAQQYVAWLLCEKSQDLRILTVTRSSCYIRSLTRDKIPELPKLEHMTVGGEEYKILHQKENFYKNIIKSAPNLKSLDPRHTFPCWKLLPDSTFFGIITSCCLQITTPGLKKQYLTIASASPRLWSLAVFNPHSSFYPTFYHVLEKWLHSSRESLTRLRFCQRIRVHTLFTRLTWPSLENLKDLEFRITQGSLTSASYALLSSIQYERTFPALQKVYIDSTTKDLNNVDAAGNRNIGQKDVNGACVSLTVSELVLSLQFRKVSLVQFKRVFPNVVTLRLLSLRSDNLPSLWQICTLWPKLNHLQLSGMAPDFWPNRDAEFCGISPEEAQALSSKNEAFLRIVQIVPVRPCITTLSNLQRLDLHLGRDEVMPNIKIATSKMFLSKVTHFLAVQRMRQVQTKVSANYRRDIGLRAQEKPPKKKFRRIKGRGFH